MKRSQYDDDAEHRGIASGGEIAGQCLPSAGRLWCAEAVPTSERTWRYGRYRCGVSSRLNGAGAPWSSRGSRGCSCTWRSGKERCSRTCVPSCSRQRRLLRPLPFRHGQVLLRGLFTVPGQPDGNVASDVTGRGHGRGSGTCSFWRRCRRYYLNPGEGLLAIKTGVLALTSFPVSVVAVFPVECVLRRHAFEPPETGVLSHALDRSAGLTHLTACLAATDAPLRANT